MGTTATKTVKKVSTIDAVLQKMIKEGKPLSAIAKYWLTDEGKYWKINDMRAVLR
ncbi:hypothetical protein FACS1894199_04040 [Bacteroidia bacterium]|nr:hypothetical protein FACS1894199_04040 [Bacteroidia bacterium]